MVVFSNPTYFYLLVFPAVVLLGYIWYWRRKKRLIQSYGQFTNLCSFMPDYSSSKYKIKSALIIQVMILTICILAGPHSNRKVATSKTVSNSEVVLCVDVSNSMLAANDASGSRMDKAKLMLESMINKLQGNSVALVVFAGNAYLQMPMSTDTEMARMYLDNLGPQMASSQGTAIGDAIKRAMVTFSQSKTTNKHIILLTDAENRDGEVTEALKLAIEKKVMVHVIGIGSSVASPIPLPDGGYMRDEAGNVIQTRFNANMAKQIARGGQGQYVHADENDAVKTIIDFIKNSNQGSSQKVSYSKDAALYQVYAFVAFILMVIQILLTEKKSKFVSRVTGDRD